MALLISAFFGYIYLHQRVFGPKDSVPTEVSTRSTPLLTKALVMPHHDLLLDQFPLFYGTFSAHDRQTIKHIILLSPNHFQPTQTIIKTRQSPFELSPTQTIPLNPDLLERLSPIKMIIKDDQVFTSEHGVFLHLPLIAHYFPQADITPLLLTRKTSAATLDGIANTLHKELQRDDTLLIVSTDFSHYLPYSQAEENDARTLALIQANNSAELLQLSDDYSDCPSCLYVLMRSLEQDSKLSPPHIIFHSNSAKFAHLAADVPTTSYFVLKW